MEPDRDDDALLVAAADDPEAFARVLPPARARRDRLLPPARRRAPSWPPTSRRRPSPPRSTGRRRFAPERGPAAAWLYGIARRQLVTFQRRGHVERRARRRLGMARIELTDEMLERVEAVADAELAHVDVALAALPDDQRAAVRARIVEDHDYDEIAAAQSISEPAARQRVSRGLAALARPHEEPGAHDRLHRRPRAAARRGPPRPARRRLVRRSVAHHDRLRRRGRRRGASSSSPSWRSSSPAPQPAASSPPTQPPQTTPVTPQPRVSLAVLNGTKITGLARGVADELTSLGYDEPNLVTNDTTNQSRARTTVYFEARPPRGRAGCRELPAHRLRSRRADGRPRTRARRPRRRRVFVGADRAR